MLLRLHNWFSHFIFFIVAAWSFGSSYTRANHSASCVKNMQIICRVLLKRFNFCEAVLYLRPNARREDGGWKFSYPKWKKPQHCCWGFSNLLLGLLPDSYYCVYFFFYVMRLSIFFYVEQSCCIVFAFILFQTSCLVWT